MHKQYHQSTCIHTVVKLQSYNKNCQSLFQNYVSLCLQYPFKVDLEYASRFLFPTMQYDLVLLLHLEYAQITTLVLQIILQSTPIWTFFLKMQVAGHWFILHNSCDMHGGPATWMSRKNVQLGFEPTILLLPCWKLPLTTPTEQLDSCFRVEKKSTATSVQ